MKGLLIEWNGATGKRPAIIEDILDIGRCTVTHGHCLVHNASPVDDSEKCPDSGLDEAAWLSLWLERMAWRRQALRKPVPDAFFGTNHRKLRTCWQQLATSPCLEICVFELEWDTSPFEGEPGITVLHNDAQIQAAVDHHCPPAFTVEDETLMKIDVEQRGVTLADVPGENANEVLQNLKAQGVKGIAERHRPSLVDVYGPPETRAANGLPE